MAFREAKVDFMMLAGLDSCRNIAITLTTRQELPWGRLQGRSWCKRLISAPKILPAKIAQGRCGSLSGFEHERLQVDSDSTVPVGV